MSRIAQRYAKAIFDVAKDAGAVDAVDADLAHVASALRDPELGSTVLSPDTRNAVRARILEKVLGSATGGGHPLTKNLLGVVLHRRREAVLSELSAAFKRLLHESRGKVIGLVETARSIDEADLQALEARATELAGKNVTLEVKINPELIGGVRIRVGNTLFDGSVATALEDLERALMEAPLTPRYY